MQLRLRPPGVVFYAATGPLGPSRSMLFLLVNVDARPSGMRDDIDRLRNGGADAVIDARSRLHEVFIYDSAIRSVGARATCWPIYCKSPSTCVH